MRRSKITGLLLIMGMFLAGCGANSGSAGIEEDAVMQELYDRSEIARGYTDPIFQEYLDQYDSDCEIKETSFGFKHRHKRSILWNISTVMVSATI